MSSPFPRITYTGATPGADSNTYNLFDSTQGQGQGANAFAQGGSHVFLLDLKNSAAGTLKVYKGGARGSAGAVTFFQIEQFAVSGVATAESGKYEFVVEPYSDWKIDWVNGGVAQTTWQVDMCLSNQRASGGRQPTPTTFQSVGAAATANAKATSGTLLAITATNRNAAARYLQVFNSTGSTATVFYQWLVPASSMLILGDDFFVGENGTGWAFSTGITWGMSTTAGSYVAATAGETDVAGSFL
jgi:hypothetical protein